tara:strand:- start:2236 stop:2445 length:210 start_codon:yes stop_codon:yes gene_type:complete
VRKALKGGKTSPKLTSQLIVYTIATAFSISPLEVYDMPAELVKDMLIIHMQAKQLEMEEMSKAEKSMTM